MEVEPRHRRPVRRRSSLVMPPPADGERQRPEPPLTTCTRRVPPLWQTSNVAVTGKWLAASTFEANALQCVDPTKEVCRGYQVTGVDLSSTCLSAARALAAKKGLSVTWEHGDMSDLPWKQTFDAAFAMGNSLGYVGDDLQNLEIAHAHECCQRARIQEVSHDDGDLMAE